MKDIHLVTASWKPERDGSWVSNNRAVISIGFTGNATVALGDDMVNHLQIGPSMAREVQVYLIDDLSGEPAQESVRFALDSVEYEIDLTAVHAAELRDVMEKYVSNGRRFRGISGNRGVRSTPSGREEAQKIRAWAKANGYKVNVRGRVSQDIRQAFESTQR